MFARLYVYRDYTGMSSGNNHYTLLQYESRWTVYVRLCFRAEYKKKKKGRTVFFFFFINTFWMNGCQSLIAATLGRGIFLVNSSTSFFSTEELDQWVTSLDINMITASQAGRHTAFPCFDFCCPAHRAFNWSGRHSGEEQDHLSCF